MERTSSPARALVRTTAALCVAIVATQCARNPERSLTRGYSPEVVDGVARLREATRPYQDLQTAVAAGYPPLVKDCLIHEHHGAMGYHHVNQGYVDRTLDVTKPEILLYEKTKDGRYRLNAVEFIVPFRVWPGDSVAPVFLGRKLHNEANLKIWYLHVWAWKPNPEGLFANFHPDVRCPDGAGKIYRPSEDRTGPFRP